MHPTNDKRDYQEQASVTALSISKDNKTVYVGDSRGRVFSWICIDNPGKSKAEHWVKDEIVEACKSCRVKFTIYERKHHCRSCGLIFCANCSRFEIEISSLNINHPVRVCQSCMSQIKSENLK